MSDQVCHWPEVELASIVTPRRKKSLPASVGDLPFIGLEHVEAHTGHIIEYGRVSEMKSAVALFEAGDVLYGRLRPYLNKVVKPDFSGSASAEFIVIPGNERLDANYLHRLLMQQSFVDFASHINQGDRPRVDFDQIGRFRFKLPPLDEQRRIVAKLDSLFAHSKTARAELAHVPRLVERAKQAVLDKAFSGELTREWREANRLPEAERVNLGSVASGFSYGSAAKSHEAGTVPVLRMGNIQNGSLDWSDLVFTSDPAEIAKYLLEPGDVLFNRTNSPALVGKTALYQGERKAIYAGYLIRVRCGPNLLPEFLTYCLNSPMGRDYCWRVKTDGVSQSNINSKKLAAFSFALPSVKEQREIVRRIEAAFARIDRLAEEARRATALLDRLEQATLAKAFRGDLLAAEPAAPVAEAAG